MSLLSTDLCEVNLEMPYISGFLGFRECPAFQQLLSSVKGTVLEPQARKTQWFLWTVSVFCMLEAAAQQANWEFCVTSQQSVWASRLPVLMG
eukprot:scaffold88009_cov29-Prasinocladus_malaysianus.AAC.1